jgi:outer membrane protein assembly factor BamB
MEVFANGCIICTVGTAIQVFDLNTGDIVKTVKGSYETPWTSALVSENMVSFACPVSQQENSQQTFIIDVIKDTNIIVSSEAVDVRSTVSLGYGLVAFAASDVFVYDMNLNQVVCRWDLPLVQDLVFLPSGYLICCDLHDTIRIFKLKNCLTYEESFGSRMKKCQEYVDIKFK